MSRDPPRRTVRCLRRMPDAGVPDAGPGAERDTNERLTGRVRHSGSGEFVTEWA